MPVHAGVASRGDTVSAGQPTRPVTGPLRVPGTRGATRPLVLSRSALPGRTGARGKESRGTCIHGTLALVRHVLVLPGGAGKAPAARGAAALAARARTGASAFASAPTRCGPPPGGAVSWGPARRRGRGGLVAARTPARSGLRDPLRVAQVAGSGQADAGPRRAGSRRVPPPSSTSAGTQGAGMTSGSACCGRELELADVNVQTDTGTRPAPPRSADYAPVGADGAPRHRPRPSSWSRAIARASPSAAGTGSTGTTTKRRVSRLNTLPKMSAISVQLMMMTL